VASDPLSQLRRGTIEYCILALLRDQDRYALELAHALTATDELVTSKGTIYPLLARLRRQGLVQSTWSESAQGPPRRYHHLTDNGRQALDEFTAHWRRFRHTVDQLLGTSS
jgi:PadR family transcriptional regulator PadR